jgi:hypothetical protein
MGLVSVRQGSIKLGKLLLDFPWARESDALTTQRVKYRGKGLIIGYTSESALEQGIEAGFELVGRRMRHKINGGYLQKAHGIRSVLGEAPKLYSPCYGFVEMWNVWDIVNHNLY